MAVIYRIRHSYTPRRFGTGPTIMTDSLTPTISPVDGSLITTRAERAEHNRRNGVIDLAPGDKKHMERTRYPIEPSDPMPDLKRWDERIDSVGFEQAYGEAGEVE
ncbi:MAG: hypothetical protein OXD40_09490 [bacterium]|nr:hypothetical protein [bacterium]